MNGIRAVGALCTALALVGYGVGLAAPYPGRAFTVTGVMVGVTLLSIGGGERE